MRKPTRALVLLITMGLLLTAAAIGAAAMVHSRAGGPNPDIAPVGAAMEPEAYLQARDRQIAQLRGIDPDGGFTDPHWRMKAVKTRFEQEAQLHEASAPTVSWAPIGPNSVTDGQGQTGPTAVSGRVTAIAVDPTDSNTAYIGSAQGGVWRTTNGGTTWTSIFDTAQSLSIGALALAPSDPTKLYVGTGEAHNSADSFFGIGLYRIDSAKTSATSVGPINPNFTFFCPPAVCGGLGANRTTGTFTGRSISKILVHPTDPATIFVATGAGFSGMGATGLTTNLPPIALLGVYRSTNATSAAASVTFTKLAASKGTSFDSPPTGNRAISDIAFVNNNANNLLVSAFGLNAVDDGGIFRSANALAATPTFTQTLQGQFSRMDFAPVASTNDIFVASSEGNGRLRRSTDGGATWGATIPGGDGFCGNQCGYDIAVAVDPDSTSPNFRIYLGGNAGAGPSGAMRVSTDGGTTFAADQNNLHADTHDIVVDTLTNPNTIWTGNDGGVWKRSATAAVGTLWTNLNNGLGTLQFQSIAVGKSDPFFTIGGTQDNGTNKQLTSSGNWDHADFGDGGFALIDQSTTSTTNVTMYHTYFNVPGTFIGFARTKQTSCANDGQWAVRGAAGADPTIGCDGSANQATNGIGLSDTTLFYAPMALGPGTPNTLYFGTDRLYRSTNQGDTMTAVSQTPIVASTPITAIGISPQNDNVRIVGLQNGQVWGTSSGSSTLVNMTSGSFPANPASAASRHVGRVVIDPNNANTAYVTFSYYAPAGQGVWKTTNCCSAVTTWASAGSGIPSIPVDSFVVDPNDSTHLYAGTDVGVYQSLNSGTSWTPFGTGLPAVAVFDMAIVQPGSAFEKLRVATHGRSMWEITLSAPTAVSVTSVAARRTGSAMVVSWRTASELGISGFNVFRNGRKLNRSLIVARRSGRAGGASYRFVDRAAKRGQPSRYRLQIVDLRGKVTWRSAAVR
jgi:photosystem II stability/assembly factor-like uncharacterized protein